MFETENACDDVEKVRDLDLPDHMAQVSERNNKQPTNKQNQTKPNQTKPSKRTGICSKSGRKRIL